MHTRLGVAIAEQREPPESGVALTTAAVFSAAAKTIIPTAVFRADDLQRDTSIA